MTEGWLLLDEIIAEDIVSDGSHTATDERYRCVVEGCDREVVVVRDSRDEAYQAPPACHGLEMMAVGRSDPKKRGPLRR